ncbi:MAG TPA: glycosyltransferase family 2 protein [Solirubrobacteraceae bacterium]|nr:glycosyltransferase family 2 protein [Solirubrobacteraceae bacterium]
MSAGPRVSVVVVTHNNSLLIGDCLRAISASLPDGGGEVIVVDNASGDDTIAAIERTGLAVEVVALQHNVGFAGGVNRGRERAQGACVALVNSDAFPDPGCIARLLERLERDPRAGIVGAGLRYPSGELQPSAGTFPSLLGGLWVALFLHRAPGLSRIGIGYLAVPGLYRRARRVDWVSGAVCAARADLPALPETTFMYGEDVRWAAACRDAGLEVWVEPAATAVHIGRASVDASQDPGFAQRQRVAFELAWFAPRGAAAVLAARGVLVLHALARIVVFGALDAARGRGGGRVREYGALARAAVTMSIPAART